VKVEGTEYLVMREDDIMASSRNKPNDSNIRS